MKIYFFGINFFVVHTMFPVAQYINKNVEWLMGLALPEQYLRVLQQRHENTFIIIKRK